MEPPIKDTIEITSEQRTRFNIPFPIVLIIILIKDNLSTKDKMARKNGSQMCPLFRGVPSISMRATTCRCPCSQAIGHLNLYRLEPGKWLLCSRYLDQWVYRSPQAQALSSALRTLQPRAFGLLQKVDP